MEPGFLANIQTGGYCKQVILYSISATKTSGSDGNGEVAAFKSDHCRRVPLHLSCGLIGNVECHLPTLVAELQPSCQGSTLPAAYRVQT